MPRGARRAADSDGEANTPRTQTQRRRGEEEEGDNEEGGAGSSRGLNQEDLQRLVKNFVRLAIACEYTRTPIRRDEIGKKVLEGNSREFKRVFDKTQERLRATLGMEMIELPAKEKHLTATQKRKQGASASAATTSKSWMLVTILPQEYKAIIVPDNYVDAQFMGLVNLVVSLVMLNGRTLSEDGLYRYLTRLQINDETICGQTSDILAKMVRTGYLTKARDPASDENKQDYHLGPRAKKEIGMDGVVTLVKEVYEAGEGPLPENLIEKLRGAAGEDIHEQRVEAAREDLQRRQAASQANGRRNKRRRNDDGDEEDDE
ncbi:hypothetical protein YB2330_004929 [Saitoella coloradoensis]